MTASSCWLTLYACTYLEGTVAVLAGNHVMYYMYAQLELL